MTMRSFSTTGTVRSPSRSDRVSGRVQGEFWVFQKRKWLIGWSWVGPNFLKKRSISRLEVFQKLARCAVGQKLVWVAQKKSVLSKIWSGNGQVDQKGQTFPKLVHPESFDFDLKLELQTCRGYLSLFCFWLVESKFSISFLIYDLTCYWLGRRVPSRRTGPFDPVKCKTRGCGSHVSLSNPRLPRGVILHNCYL